MIGMETAGYIDSQPAQGLPPMISIAIPTYNRAEELRLTLESLTRLKAAEIEHEILIIDNHCSDSTADVVESAAGRFSDRLRRVVELKQGLCHARNRAIVEARGEIVAFLDDDVEVDPAWLQALASAFSCGDYAAVGGKAYLIYPQMRPAWITDRDEGLLSKVDHGADRRPAKADELFGLNLSFRKEWLRRVGGFRTDLDRVGTLLLSGGDTELLERLERAGGSLLYEPAAVVGHRVAPERLRRRWFFSRLYWGFRSEARYMPDEEAGWYGLARMNWYAGRAACATVASLLRHGARSPECFAAAKRIAASVGKAIGIAGRLLADRRGCREPLAPSLENL